MSQKQNAFVGGVAILSVAGMISKVLGMFFRVPLMNMIGENGMGLYQFVYPTYALLLTLSAAGMPVAVSRIVSESLAAGEPLRARQALRVSMQLLAAIGALFSVLLFAFAGPVSRLISGGDEAALGFRAIAPAILLVSVMSALRGYLQGREKMTPTAISQIIEQVAKVAISLPLAAFGNRYGVEYAAAGALVGITVGEGLSLFYMAVAYRRGRPAFLLEEKETAGRKEPLRALLSEVIRLALPITIGAMVVPLSQFIDSAMIQRRLLAAGIAAEEATGLYGLLSGSAVSLINVPTVFATAVCIGLVPAISAARTRGQASEVHRISVLGLRLGSLIGLPCSVGLSMLATPVVRLLFPALSPESIQINGDILALSALTIFFFTQVQATTGILQGAGLHKVPMLSLAFGVVFKIVLNYALIGLPGVNIFGAPIASLVCYGVALAVNAYFVFKRLGTPLSLSDVLLRPAAATLGMAAVIFAAERVLNMESRWSGLIAVCVGGAAYLVLIFALGALRREDMDTIPGGPKLARLMNRVGIWRNPK